MGAVMPQCEQWDKPSILTNKTALPHPSPPQLTSTNKQVIQKIWHWGGGGEAGLGGGGLLGRMERPAAGGCSCCPPKALTGLRAGPSQDHKFWRLLSTTSDVGGADMGRV